MALKNTDPNAEYPYVFMVSQSINQLRPQLATDPAEYTLSVVLMNYKIDENGQLVFDYDSQYSYTCDNFTALAFVNYSQGNATHLQTLGAQQLSIKEIVETELGITLEVL